MRSSDDPFDARPTAELLATDALLDRVGARTPTPDDLDDPLVAALALMAAEIDLDAVPVESSRTALARTVPDLDVAATTRSAQPSSHDDATGLVLDLRDPAPEPPAAHDPLRGPRRRPRRTEPVGGPVAMAPPRSLARMPSSTGPGRSSRNRPERRLRPMMAVAVAVTAIVLGSGVSAAVTGGRSVNPLTGIQQVVAQLNGERTQAQAKAYEEARRALDLAETYADRGQDERARAELRKARELTNRMTDQDEDAVRTRVDQLERRIGR